MNININNYEEWMIDYLEGNLTRQQEKQLTHFLEAHPELRAELELFQHTKLRPDMNLVFENKEILKKQETGRVITMASWKKYSIGVAAALLLFAGIRFMNTSSPANGVKYEAKQITKPMFAFENKRMEADTAEIITDSIKDKKTDSYFAESGNKKTNDNEEQLKKDGGNEWKRDVTLMTDELEYAAADHIDHKRLRGKIKESNLTYSRDEYAMSLGYKNKETETIIDKWNNTVAFAESVGGIFGFGERENQRNITDDNYNETKIKIFDIEYYNRKTTNK